MATNSRNTSCKQQATFASVAASYSEQQERHGKNVKYSSTKLDLKDKKDFPIIQRRLPSPYVKATSDNLRSTFSCVISSSRKKSTAFNGNQSAHIVKYNSTCKRGILSRIQNVCGGTKKLLTAENESGCKSNHKANKDPATKDKAKYLSNVSSCSSANQKANQNSGNAKFLSKISNAIAQYLVIHGISNLTSTKHQTDFLTSSSFWAKSKLCDRMLRLSNFLKKNYFLVNAELIRLSENKPKSLDFEYIVKREKAKQNLKSSHKALTDKNIVRMVKKNTFPK
ncbi:uncharacterized protein LOC144431994 [Styela clava]